MENILKNIKINNSRISAIDGRIEDLSNYKNLAKSSMSNYEIACTLSHIKAINYLSTIYGNYFLVLEDDISFENIKYFTTDLKTIILNAPSFDILLIGKTQLRSFSSNPIYSHYSGEYGAFSYVISKKGVDKLISYAKYINQTNFNINKPLCVSELFIFNNLNTYIYKYNYISTQDLDSDIHQSHIPWHRKCSILGKTDILSNLENI